MSNIVWLKPTKEKLDVLAKNNQQVEDKEIEDNMHKKLYRIFVTRSRLQGYCRMLILGVGSQEGVEYFELNFGREGIRDHQSFDDATAEEIRQYLLQEEHEEISYQQGLELLRDALLQNYKYETNMAMVHRRSEHLENAARYRPVGYQETRKYYLEGIGTKDVMYGYLKAVMHDDSALVYDMLSDSAQKSEGSRDIFCYHWNHLLEGYKIIRILEMPGGDVYKQNLRVLLRTWNNKLLEMGIYFELRREEGCLRIEQIKYSEPLVMQADSALNPVNEMVFVVAIDGVSDEVVGVLDEHQDVQKIADYQGIRCYKWFRKPNIELCDRDVTEAYLIQILITDRQMIIYGKFMHEINQAIEHILRLTRQTLAISLKGVDTIEHIYYTAILKRESYLTTTKESYHFQLEGNKARMVVAKVAECFGNRWYYYSNGNASVCEWVGAGWIEVGQFFGEIVVHFYNAEPEELLAKERLAPYHDLIKQVMQDGKRVDGATRTFETFDGKVFVDQECCEQASSNYKYDTNEELRFI